MFVFAENLVVPVIFLKMFTDETHKPSGDVFSYVHAGGRIKSNYVSLPVVSYRFFAFSVH